MAEIKQMLCGEGGKPSSSLDSRPGAALVNDLQVSDDAVDLMQRTRGAKSEVGVMKSERKTMRKRRRIRNKRRRQLKPTRKQWK